MDASKEGVRLRAEGEGPPVTTAPWPGPGNSEGPVDPEGWTYLTSGPAPADEDRVDWRAVPFTTNPWPGPGDSEG